MMAKEKLFKNVLSGHVYHDRNLEFLVVIDSDEMKALYCGTLEAFALPQSMTEFRRALDKRLVKKSQTIGATKLVIFV